MLVKIVVPTIFCLLVSLTALAQTSGEQDSVLVFSPTVKVTLQTGFVFFSLPGEKILSYRSIIAGVGLLPESAWIPAPHFYVSYSRTSFEQFSGLSGISVAYGNDWGLCICPAFKIFQVFVVGYGYYWGAVYKKFHSTSWGTPDNREISYRESGFFPLIGLDIDLRVYRNAYLALGLSMPPAVVNAGISLRL